MTSSGLDGWAVLAATLFTASTVFYLARMVRGLFDRRQRPTPAPAPPTPADAWCAGCDRIVPASQMGWSDEDDYRCAQCLGITTSSGWAEAAIQLRDAQLDLRKKVVPPKGGGGVVLPHQRASKRVCSCPDCVAFGPHHDAGEPFPFKDWGSSDTVLG